MQRSDNGYALLACVEEELRAVESLCGNIERALMRRNWDELDLAISDTRRLTHALQNAMDDAASVRDEAFDESVLRRLRHVQAIRENQMTRLQQYQDAVGERLRLIARWKSALRSIGTRPAQSTLGSLDRFS